MQRSRQGWASVLVMGFLVAGCHGPGRAKVFASARSGCEADNVEVVRHDDNNLVLDVCGVHEDWEWDGFNGWEYVGLAATQPTPAPAAAETAPVAPASDEDGDGVLDPDDRCPSEAGPAHTDPTLNGCPAAQDSDGDAIPDKMDSCPQEKGLPNPAPERHGCPPPGDTDGDGINDDRDACPNEAGQASPDPERNGCTQDADGDGVADAADACPQQEGVEGSDERLNGCPEGDVVVTSSAVVLAAPLAFAEGKPVLTNASYPGLDKLAQTMKDQPELKVEITAYADAGMSDEMADKMSTARAEAVKKALVGRGVEAERLTTKGGGEAVSGPPVTFAVDR